MSEWIKITDRSPKDGEQVLVSDGKEIQLSHFLRVGNRGGYVFPNTITLNKPTHWMPLPEPPKEDNP